ncbi:MAG: hypothetical protein QM696_02640 [Steroidobacteraceae bacterium]
MKAAAVLMMFCAWGCMFLAPRTTLSTLLQLLVFGAAGALFTLAGGFSWWWAQGREDRSALIMVCGLLTLAPVAWVWLWAAADAEFGPDPRAARRRDRGKSR